MSIEQSIAPETEEDIVNFIMLRTIDAQTAADGTSRRPFEEFSTAMLGILRSAEALESNDDYMGEHHLEMIKELDALTTQLLKGTPYGKHITKALILKARRTRKMLVGMLEMKENISENIESRKKHWDDMWREKMQEYAVLPKGDDRDDLMLSAFIYLNEWGETQFETHWDPAIYRDIFTDMCANKGWEGIFAKPHDVARAFYRRGWMTEEQIDELLIEWD